MAALTSTRAVARFNTDTTLPRDVSEDMILREPNANRLFVLTGANKRKKPSDVPLFEWFEDQEVTFWGACSGTALSSAATGIAVADVTIFVVGDLVAVPVSQSSSTGEEVMLVTAITGASVGTITVTRNIGSTVSDTIGATASLRIIGSAIAEDSDTPTQRYQAQTQKASYCQIFRTPVQITHTAASTKKYGGPDRKYQLIKALIRHRSEIEASGLWGRAYQSLTGTSSIWASMGLKPIIATNKTSNQTTLTQTAFNTFSETAFRFGEDQKLLMCAPKVLSAINNFSMGKNFNTYVDDKVFGLSLQRYIAPLGEYLLHNNYRLEAAGAGGNGYEDEAYSIDLPSVGLRYLDGGEGLIGDTKLYQDVQQDGTTVRVDEYRSQMGWEFRHEIKHAILSGVAGYS